MSEVVTMVVLTVLIIGLFMHYEGSYGELINVESRIDRETYLVRNRDDKEEAANLLASIKTRLQKLVNNLHQRLPDDERVQRLVMKFKPSEISESLPGTNYTSYSVNKGEKIVFCIRSKDEHEKLMDINTMMFVAIHEIAHIATKSVGHTDEFWDNMKFLLKEAIDDGLYVKQDFKSNPVDYCGIKITDSPLD